MTLAIGKFVHRPVYVDAVQVTSENMGEVAEWCDGSIVAAKGEVAIHIKVSVLRPKRIRETTAFVDDWVLKTNQGYKVYHKTAFKNSFNPAEVSDPAVLKQLEKVFS